MAYIGNTPISNFASITKDAFSGDGSTTAFTLSKAATTNGVAVFVENVRQEPTTAYSVSGTTLTFTAAPVSSSGNNIYVLHHNSPASTATHPAAQNLLAVDGTFSGNIDVDGTTNLDVVDIDGALTQDGGAVFNEASADVDFRIESNGKANMFCVDAGNDSVIIGHNAKISAVGGLDSNLQLVSGDAQPSLDIVCFSDNANHRGQVTFSKSANDTIGTGTAVGTSDLIGDIVWGAHDGTDFANEVAFIRGSINSGGVGSNDTGGKLEFGTSADGNNSGTTRMRIYDEGRVFVGSDSEHSAIAAGGLNIKPATNTHQLMLEQENGSNGAEGWLFHASSAGGPLTFTRRTGSSDTARFRIASGGDLTATDTDGIGSISDERLKKDIVDFTYSIDDFKKYKPRQFNWKNPELHLNQTNTIGFIAQELEAVDNRFVYETTYYDVKDTDEYKALEKKVTDKIATKQETNTYNQMKLQSEQNKDNLDKQYLDADGVAKASKLLKKDAMYVSVIQQLIARIEALESK